MSSGSRNDMINKEFNSVQRNLIWRELVRKEVAHQKIRTGFTANPATLATITTKPQQSVWSQRYNTNLVQLPGETHVAVVPPPNDKELMQIMERSQMAPHEKYDRPLTSSQEIGWETKPLVPSMKGAKWHQGLKSSSITKFADYFICMQGQSPYVNSNDRAPAARKAHN